MAKSIHFPTDRVQSEFPRVSVFFPVVVDGQTLQCIASGELLDALSNCGFSEDGLVKAGMDNIGTLHANARRLIEAGLVSGGEVLLNTKNFKR